MIGVVGLIPVSQRVDVVVAVVCLFAENCVILIVKAVVLVVTIPLPEFPLLLLG